MNNHSGSCLCGAVRFEIDGAFERFYLCHCAYCRKDTGSAHAANLLSPTATVRWLAGIEHVRQFDLPSTRHSKAFCMICGSALPCLQMQGALLAVPAGSLDSAVAQRPDAHIFMASKADWDEALQTLPRLDGFPLEPGAAD